jgi:oxygen-independent coproporphyrinogen-3 oxidase
MMYSLYFHIPFCTHRCAYCDFNTYAGQASFIPAYVDALCNEIRSIAGSAPKRLSVHTIFFGGGTPSLLTPWQYEQILQTITGLFDLSGLATLEASLEANPGTVTLDSLHGLRQVGFNRISFGVQSFHVDELRQLERIHDPFDVLEAVRWARQAGFENLNLDLIYGLPEQTLLRWQESLRRAVNLGPEHLSLYALTIEHGTPFGRWAARGLLPMPDPDLAADMYEAASETLAGQGYEQYEISNWSKPGFQCRHNLQYWRNLPYLGFGAGAHGCANGLRIANVLRIKPYIDRLAPDREISSLAFPLSPATVSCIRITRRVEMQETLMLGLRLTQEGISPEAFQARFEQPLMDVFGKEIFELIDLELLEWTGIEERVRLTRRGRLLGNQVFLRFFGN